MLTKVEIQTLATQLAQAVTGVAILKSGQLIIHFDADGQARRVEVNQSTNLDKLSMGRAQ